MGLIGTRTKTDRNDLSCNPRIEGGTQFAQLRAEAESVDEGPELRTGAYAAGSGSNSTATR